MRGDVVLYSKLDDKLHFIKKEEYSSDLFLSKWYHPVAVVVVPSSHVSDGTTRCISIKAMNCSTPTKGSDSWQHMKLAPSGNTSLTNFNKFPVGNNPWSTTAATNTESGITVNGGANIYPSFTKYLRYNTAYKNASNPTLYYNKESKTSEKPSFCYKKDGKTLNSQYNIACIADMDGKSNSQVYLKSRGGG